MKKITWFFFSRGSGALGLIDNRHPVSIIILLCAINLPSGCFHLHIPKLDVLLQKKSMLPEMIPKAFTSLLIFLLFSANTYSAERDSIVGTEAFSNGDIFFNAVVPTVSPTASFYGGPHHLVPGQDLVFEPVSQQDVSGDWVVLLFLLCLLLLAISRFFFPGRTRYILRSAVGLRFFYMVNKQGNLYSETPSFLLKINFLLVVSLLLYQSLAYAGMHKVFEPVPSFLVYCFILLGLTFFYVAKRVLMQLLGWVFAAKRQTELYFNNLFVFNQFAGVLLIPAVFFHAYHPSTTGLYAAWALLILVNLYKIVRGVIITHGVSGYSLFHLFLYLCAVELAPLLIMGTMVSVYLFNS